MLFMFFDLTCTLTTTEEIFANPDRQNFTSYYLSTLNLTTMTAQTPITAVVIDSSRVTAEKIEEQFKGTPYKVAAVLDQAESQEGLRYRPQNLAVLLNALYPRPRVLITGTSLPDNILKDLGIIWNSYVKRWGVDAIWVATSKTHQSSSGPSSQEALEHVRKALDEKFSN